MSEVPVEVKPVGLVERAKTTVNKLSKKGSQLITDAKALLADNKPAIALAKIGGV